MFQHKLNHRESRKYNKHVNKPVETYTGATCGKTRRRRRHYAKCHTVYRHM